MPPRNKESVANDRPKIQTAYIPTAPTTICQVIWAFTGSAVDEVPSATYNLHLEDFVFPVAQRQFLPLTRLCWEWHDTIFRYNEVVLFCDEARFFEIVKAFPGEWHSKASIDDYRKKTNWLKKQVDEEYQLD